MPSQDNKHKLEVLQMTYDELQRCYTLLRLIKADLEKLAKNLNDLSSEYCMI